MNIHDISFQPEIVKSEIDVKTENPEISVKMEIPVKEELVDTQPADSSTTMEVETAISTTDEVFKVCSQEACFSVHDHKKLVEFSCFCVNVCFSCKLYR